MTILLANGAELNSQDHYVEYPNGNQGSTTLIEATRGGFIEISKQLIFKGTNRSISKQRYNNYTSWCKYDT